MDAKEMLGTATQLFEDAKATLENAEASAEDLQESRRKIDEAKQLQERAASLREILVKGTEIATKVGKQAEVLAPGKFMSFGHYLYHVGQAGNIRYRGPIDPRLRVFNDRAEPQGLGIEGKSGWPEADKATMVEHTGARGGFLVPPEYLPTLYAVEAEANVVRRLATIIPMARRQINMPSVDQTDTTAGKPHWFGGMVADWVEEGGEKSKSEPEFRQIELVAHKLVVYSRASDELMEDNAVGLAAFLNSPMGFTGAINWEEEYCFLQGTGAGQPLGIILAGATITVARAAGGTVGIADLANMLQAFLMTGGRGVWMITQSALATLLQISGPVGNLSYVFMPSAREGVPSLLFGMPIYWTEKVPVLGTAGDVCLCNWPYYLIGDRKRTTIESTNIERFRHDETSWRCVHRVDGQPWLSAPLTLQDGSTQISPFVILGDKDT